MCELIFVLLRFLEIPCFIVPIFLCFLHSLRLFGDEFSPFDRYILEVLMIHIQLPSFITKRIIFHIFVLFLLLRLRDMCCLFPHLTIGKVKSPQHKLGIRAQLLYRDFAVLFK